MKYSLIVLLLGMSLIAVHAMTTSSVTTCLQESANESTSCGGLGTGGYAMLTCDTNTPWCTNYYWGGCTDNNQSTHCQVLQGGDSNRTMTLWINYTKPEGATKDSAWIVTATNTSRWYQDHATPTRRQANYTLQIPAGCFEQQPLQFRYTDTSFMHQGHCNNASTTYTCYNGNNWEPLQGLGTTPSDACLERERSLMYEEGMSWQLG